MKASKAKSNKKASKKASKRVVKKELEDSITAKFMEAISDLGQDAKKIGKDIKKASKQIAKKLADKFKDVKTTVGDSFEEGKKSRIKDLKKPLTTPMITSPKPITKAERVVARATQANAEIRPKRSYTRRNVTPVSATGTAARKPRPTAKPAASKPATPTKLSEESANGSVAPSSIMLDQTPAPPQTTERSDQTRDDNNNIQ